MPLARFALYAQGIDIHIAPTYDSGEGWIGTMQYIAKQGGCWVIGAGVALRNRDLPDDLPERETLYDNRRSSSRPERTARATMTATVRQGLTHVPSPALAYAAVTDTADKGPVTWSACSRPAETFRGSLHAMNRRSSPQTALLT
jgi:hypothetical protein